MILLYLVTACEHLNSEFCWCASLFQQGATPTPTPTNRPKLWLLQFLC